MATLPTQTFTQLVQNQVAAIQGAAAGLIDFTVGSILRAAVEAFSQTVLWLQGLIIVLLSTTRLSTSAGADADSWGADFDFTREQAVAASAEETFGRLSTNIQGIVPIGSTVELQDGSQQYAVIIDATNPAYSASLGGYVLPVGVSTISVPVKAAVAGSGANCINGAINTITSSIPGVDFCTNAQPVENGEDKESDAAFRVRFVAYINSLSKAIRSAIELAVTSVQLNVTCAILENQTYTGQPQPGFFCVIVNDGSGFPPSSLLAACGTAIEAVRGLTIQYGVFPPQVLPVSAALTIQVAAGFNKAGVVSTVENAIEHYMGALLLGQPMPVTRLSQLAYDASPGVIDVSGMLLNGATNDIDPASTQLIQPSTVVATAL